MADTEKKVTEVKAAKTAVRSAAKASTTKKAGAAKPKKATAKKTKTTRKPTAKALLAKATAVYNIEFQGRSVTDKELAEKAVKDFMSKTGKTSLKKIELFVQPENSVAYYAIDGEGGDQFQINI